MTTCRICGEEIIYRKTTSVPRDDPFFNSLKEIRLAGERHDRALLKHVWDKHRDEFPPEFKTFTQFYKWLKSSESRDWRLKRALVFEAEEIVTGQSRYSR
jgi:hypothetical protein